MSSSNAIQAEEDHLLVLDQPKKTSFQYLCNHLQ